MTLVDEQRRASPTALQGTMQGTGGGRSAWCTTSLAEGESGAYQSDMCLAGSRSGVDDFSVP